MKVIKDGKRGPGWVRKYICNGRHNSGKGCGATLLVTKEDLRYFPGVYSESWGAKDPAVCFKCIACSSITDIPKDEWPNDYQSLEPFTHEWYKSSQ
jgi:hypothetical protein